MRNALRLYGNLRNDACVLALLLLDNERRSRERLSLIEAILAETRTEI